MNDRNSKKSYQDVVQEAKGLHDLAMDREAEALLRTVPQDSEDYVEARTVLAATLLNSPGCAEVAKWGPDLVRKNPENMRLALSVTGCLMNSGNPKAAVEISRPWFGQMNSGVKLLNYSQLASAAECDSDAAAALTRLFSDHREHAIQSLMDGIICSFWERALVRPLDEPTCIHLAAPVYREFCESLEPEHWLDTRIDYACLKQVPEPLRQWIHKDYGFFNIRPDAPPKALETYRKWQNKMADKSVSLIMQVTQKAMGQLRDRQLIPKSWIISRDRKSVGEQTSEVAAVKARNASRLIQFKTRLGEIAKVLAEKSLDILSDDLNVLPFCSDRQRATFWIHCTFAVESSHIVAGDLKREHAVFSSMDEKNLAQSIYSIVKEAYVVAAVNAAPRLFSNVLEMAPLEEFREYLGDNMDEIADDMWRSYDGSPGNDFDIVSRIASWPCESKTPPLSGNRMDELARHSLDLWMQYRMLSEIYVRASKF